MMATKVNLHPAITHINADKKLSKKTIKAINKMVELALNIK